MTAVFACLLCMLTSCGGSDSGTPVPAPRTEPRSFDASDLTMLQSQWWTWAAATPLEINPVADSTGEHCTRDQPKDVWLLAGSFGEPAERTCTVPAGVPLAGPAVNLWSEASIDCEEFMRDAEGEVTLDGKALELSSAVMLPITFRGNDDNPVTGAAGEFDGYGCGLWFSVLPLDQGEHLLTIQGSSSGLTIDVTYHLTVSASA